MLSAASQREAIKGGRSCTLPTSICAVLLHHRKLLPPDPRKHTQFINVTPLSPKLRRFPWISREETERETRDTLVERRRRIVKEKRKNMIVNQHLVFILCSLCASVFGGERRMLPCRRAWCAGGCWLWELMWENVTMQCTEESSVYSSFCCCCCLYPK